MTPPSRWPPRSPRPDDSALLRYVSGESPLAESEAIREWLAADPDLAASVAELRAAWSNPAADGPSWDKSGVWGRIALGMGDEPRGRRSAPSIALPQRRHWAPFAIAATLTLMLGGGATAVWLRSPAPVVEQVTMREVATARGQQAVMDLADGSRVTLAADSKLHIPSDFNKQRRELQLEGRAYFVVVHDTTRPFVVHTATATTEDIGTAFIITAYPEMRATKVVVTEGSVALREPAGSKPLMLLTRGDVATLNAAGTATLVRNANVGRLLSWTTGVLSFDNARLRDALSEIERWYDVDIRLAHSSLGERRVTAQLRSEPASRATERLSLVLGVKARAVGRVITLSR